MVKDFVNKHMTSQVINFSIMTSYGLLHPSELLKWVYKELTLDFVVGSPNSYRNTTILVMVNHILRSMCILAYYQKTTWSRR